MSTKALVRDTKHFLTLRRCEQFCFASGKCTPAVKRVADTKLQNFLEYPTVYRRALAKLSPLSWYAMAVNISTLKGVPATAGLQLRTEIRLKPCKGVPGFHEMKFRF